MRQLKMKFHNYFLLSLIAIFLFPLSASAEVVNVNYYGPVDLSAFSCQWVSRSSFINRVCYDINNMVIIVSLNGTYYPYCGVTADIVNNWHNASSMGEYYNYIIKPQYQCQNTDPYKQLFSPQQGLVGMFDRTPYYRQGRYGQKIEQEFVRQLEQQKQLSDLATQNAIEQMKRSQAIQAQREELAKQQIQREIDILKLNNIRTELIMFKSAFQTLYELNKNADEANIKANIRWMKQDLAQWVPAEDIAKIPDMMSNSEINQVLLETERRLRTVEKMIIDYSNQSQSSPHPPSIYASSRKQEATVSDRHTNALLRWAKLHNLPPGTEPSTPEEYAELRRIFEITR